VRVIYVNHTAEVSGGERSLLALLGGLPERVRPLLAAPAGPLSEAAGARGVEIARIAGTSGSLRLHPRHTPRALLQLAIAGTQVRRLALGREAALVHANSIRAGLALAASGLSVSALSRSRRVARIVHVRDCLPRGTVSDATLRLIGATATTVLANSHHTARSVLAVAPHARVEVAYSPVDLARFDPGRIERAAARARLGVAGAREFLIGVVAQLTQWKGQETAVRALELVRSQGVDAHLLLVGSAKFLSAAARHDNAAYIEHLRSRIEAAGLSERVSWLGEREDVPELMRALDVLLMPSTEEPFGRAAAEAMAMEVPVLATNVGGPAEIVRDGVDGHLLPPGDPEAWGRALAQLAASPQTRAEMGRAGGERAREQFSLERHVKTVMAVYDEALRLLQSG
jgi:glycosyltransferase involved in cell wall biosynthesis